MIDNNLHRLTYPAMDPLQFKEMLWPHISFYDEQIEIIYSFANNDETYVPAANKMGKDFISGFLCLWFFLSRHPCRIVTTSVKDEHLSVLWGEIGRFIDTSKIPLDVKRGGPLQISHRMIKRVINDRLDTISYVKGMVAEKPESLQGHHANPTDYIRSNDRVPRTAVFGDEASALHDEVRKVTQTWASRSCWIGNCWETENFFKRAMKGGPNDPGGDRMRTTKRGFSRKVIRIKAEQSPNVKYALDQIARGEDPDNTIIIPGVRSWAEYVELRATLDEHEQCVILDADFYEGKELLLFPPVWLNYSEELFNKIGNKRKAKSLGIDTAMGGDQTSWTAGDDLGVIERLSIKTPDTNIIIGKTIEMGKRLGVPPTKWVFDRGGGDGKAHADRLRAMGFPVRTVHFGEAATDVNKHVKGMKTRKQKEEIEEVRSVYANRRVEMYHLASMRVNPENGGYAIDPNDRELRRQLAVHPKLYDERGRQYLPPKHKKPDSQVKAKSITEMLGCSPDEADSFVLMIYGLSMKPATRRAGVLS